MQRLEVSGAVRLIYRSLGVKGLISVPEVAVFFVPNYSLPLFASILTYISFSSTCVIV